MVAFGVIVAVTIQTESFNLDPALLIDIALVFPIPNRAIFKPGVFIVNRSKRSVTRPHCGPPVTKVDLTGPRNLMFPSPQLP